MLQLADALSAVSHLRSLDLGGNDIKAEGISALMKAIEGHKELRQLELGYNVIGAEGAQAVADALKYNPTVRFAASPSHLDVDSIKFRKSQCRCKASSQLHIHTQLRPTRCMGTRLRVAGNLK